jgi:hypothetical protein
VFVLELLAADLRKPSPFFHAAQSGWPREVVPIGVFRSGAPRNETGASPLSCRSSIVKREGTMNMKTLLFVVTAGALALAAQSGVASAKGCIKGALVGGVAGHYAGHHGLVGAAAGCAIGRHEANKKAREQRERERTNGTATAPR